MSEFDRKKDDIDFRIEPDDNPVIEVISKVEVIDMCKKRLGYTMASNALNEIIKELKEG